MACDAAADRQRPKVPAAPSAAADRLWRSYCADMLLPQDSASEYGTSYGTQSASAYARSWGQLTSAGSGAAAAKGAADLADGGFRGRERFNRSLTWVWVLLSMSVFGVCAFALVQPYWFVSSRQKKTSLGVINYCVQRSGDEWCAYYSSDGFSIAGLPSLSWRTSLLTYVAGCAVLAVASLQAAFCLCIGQPHKRRLSLAAGYFQLLAVILLITSLLIYPVGLDSPAAKSACDDSGIYYSGSCYVGWSYALAVAGTALCAFCPVLSHYVDYPLWETSRCSNSEM